MLWIGDKYTLSIGDLITLAIYQVAPCHLQCAKIIHRTETKMDVLTRVQTLRGMFCNLQHCLAFFA